MISNGSPTDTDEQLANTDGKPVEGAEVRIVTLDGRVAGPDEEGEVRVRGPDGLPRLHRPRPHGRGLRRRRVLPHRATWECSGPTATSP